MGDGVLSDDDWRLLAAYGQMDQPARDALSALMQFIVLYRKTTTEQQAGLFRAAIDMLAAPTGAEPGGNVVSLRRH